MSDAPDLRSPSPAPVVEVRKRRQIIWDSGKTLTQYRVIVDGRVVDSFLSRERAEREAEKLRGATCPPR